MSHLEPEDCIDFGRPKPLTEQRHPTGVPLLDHRQVEPLPRPAPVEYRLEWSDVLQGIPPEYHEATLNPSLRATLNAPGAMTVALLGPPGTGKTWQAWAMLRASRLRRLCTDDPTLIRASFAPKDAPARCRWVEAVLGRDRVRIISEAVDVLGHRYDRDWIHDEIVPFRGWLVVDDLAAVPPSDWTREAAMVIAHERRARYLPTMWTSNLAPDEIRAQYSAAIASRILGGSVINAGGADRRVTA